MYEQPDERLNTWRNLIRRPPFWNIWKRELSAHAQRFLRPVVQHKIIQHRKPAIHGLPVTLSMLRVKSDKSDWLRIRNDYSAHAQKIGPSQRSWFLVLPKRSAASGDKNSPGGVKISCFFFKLVSSNHHVKISKSENWFHSLRTKVFRPRSWQLPFFSRHKHAAPGTTSRFFPPQSWRTRCSFQSFIAITFQFVICVYLLCRDVMWQGTTDDGCVALADLLGWKVCV